MAQAYQILGFQSPEDALRATNADIQRMYRVEARKRHPDRGGSAEEFMQLFRVYEYLCETHVDSNLEAAHERARQNYAGHWRGPGAGPGLEAGPGAGGGPAGGAGTKDFNLAEFNRIFSDMKQQERSADEQELEDAYNAFLGTDYGADVDPRRVELPQCVRARVDNSNALITFGSHACVDMRKRAGKRVGGTDLFAAFCSGVSEADEKYNDDEVDGSALQRLQRDRERGLTAEEAMRLELEETIAMDKMHRARKLMQERDLEREQAARDISSAYMLRLRGAFRPPEPP